MIGALRDWFQALSGREKILIAILGVLLAGTIGYFGIAKPFWGALESAEQSYKTATERQARIGAKVAALTGEGESNAQPIYGPINLFISRSAGEAGFAVGKIDSQTNGRVNMTVDSAKPSALFGWLARIEARGISVDGLSVNPADNGTISADIALRRTVR